MKTILLSLALATVATVSNAETFQLKANLSVDADTLYVNSGGHRDAIANKNGQFEVTRDLDKATELTISLKKYAMPGDAMIKFMAMPGETATVRGNLDYFELGGSEFYQQYNMMCKAVEPAEQIQETNIKWGENLRKKKVDNDSTFATFQILRKD